MKKVLIIAYNFPPCGGPSVQRTLKFVKYLRHYDWEPVVLTVKEHVTEFDQPLLNDPSLAADVPENLQVIRTPAFDLSRRWKANAKTGTAGEKEQEPAAAGHEPKRGILHTVLRILKAPLRWFFSIPDFKAGWNPWAFFEGVKIIYREGIAVIYISAYPYSSFLLGPFLRLVTGRPYVLDFRDEWSECWIKPGGLKAAVHPLRRRVEEAMESFVVCFAKKVISVTPSIIDNFRRRYPRQAAGKFVCITNGYDGSDFPVVAGNHRTDKFTLSYVGTLYPMAACEPLLKSVKELCEEDSTFESKIRIRFTGEVKRAMEPLFEQYPLKCIERTGYLPHAESIKYLYKSDVLLLLLNDYIGAERTFTGKIFEYAGAGKPIFAICPKGEIERFVHRHQRGVHVLPDDLKGIKDNIHRLYKHYEQHRNLDRFYSRDELAEYERKNLTGKLAEVLNNAGG